MTEAIDQLPSASDCGDLVELDAPWRFVTEGRWDEAELGGASEALPEF